MPKFTVKLKETVFYTVEVEAEDEDEAGEAAADIWAQSEDPNEDFNGMGHGVEVDGVETA